VLLIFDGGKSTKPTAAPLFSQLVIELHLRVEFKNLYNEKIEDKNMEQVNMAAITLSLVVSFFKFNYI